MSVSWNAAYIGQRQEIMRAAPVRVSEKIIGDDWRMLTREEVCAIWRNNVFAGRRRRRVVALIGHARFNDINKSHRFDRLHCCFHFRLSPIALVARMRVIWHCELFDTAPGIAVSQMCVYVCVCVSVSDQ